MQDEDEVKRAKDGLRKVVTPPSDEVVDALYELGFDRQNVGVLYLVPLIFVAWADGTVQKKEADLILDLARGRGFARKATELLGRLLEYRPDERYLRRCLRVLARMYGSLPVQEGTRAKRDLIELSWEIARASGGFLGLGDKVSDEEKDLLEKIAVGLKISQSARAAALRENLISQQFQAVTKLSDDDSGDA